MKSNPLGEMSHYRYVEKSLKRTSNGKHSSCENVVAKNDKKNTAYQAYRHRMTVNSTDLVAK